MVSKQAKVQFSINRHSKSKPKISYHNLKTVLAVKQLSHAYRNLSTRYGKVKKTLYHSNTF